ncbi:MAG: putative dual-specificity RNA methyltransferase RlmN [Candidatus Anoxychlamydiales bacterium]|nr:putative dual-specificity RNA methyltransferase RlmN [Candidatus Anoxychlamydiales bacterium]
MNILNIDQNKLKQILVSNNFKAFSANQIFEWIYKKGILSFDEMTNLSKDLRDFLNKNFKVCSLKVKTIELSKDEQTKKYLFELEDGYFIESVLILSDTRKTICVSSQVGCPVRCSFCASGKKGFFRNLKAFEIVEQVLLIAKDINEKSTNIVFMGMGEPLLNFDEVVKAVKIMSDDKYLNISQRRITISTAGILENIKRLKDENLKVYLALSLHGATDEIRNRIIPYSKKYKLQDILKELRLYFEKTKRDILFEYILIESVNDSIEDAKKLVHLLKNFQCTINLIPYNEVENLSYKRPSGVKILKFKNYLISKGLNVVQRYTKGKDIAASCGQLAYKRRL